MKISAAPRKMRCFDPHETARVQSLAGVPLASFWSRAAAFTIDFMIVIAIYIPVEIVRQYLVLEYTHQPFHIATNFNFRELGDLIFLVLYSGFSVWLTNGQTIGKCLLRIRVVSLKYPVITLWQALERALGYGASTLEGGFGFIQFFIHHNRQCVHDRIAETIVVMEQAREQSESWRRRKL